VLLRATVRAEIEGNDLPIFSAFLRVEHGRDAGNALQRAQAAAELSRESLVLFEGPRVAEVIFSFFRSGRETEDCLTFL